MEFLSIYFIVKSIKRKEYLTFRELSFVIFYCSNLNLVSESSKRSIFNRDNLICNNYVVSFMKHIKNTKTTRLALWENIVNGGYLIAAYRRRLIAAGRCHANTHVSVLFDHRIRIPDRRHMQEPKVQQPW